MDGATKRRLTPLIAGVVVAAAVTMLTQAVLHSEAVVDAEPYAVVVGLGVAMPLLLAAAYPRTGGLNGRSKALLVVAEGAAGVVVGVAAVSLLVATGVPTMLPVGVGAASTYVGATAARALVLGRLTAAEKATP